MRKNMIVVDDFYEDAYGIREYALSQEFNTEGNYPGIRTKCTNQEPYFSAIKKYLEEQVLNTKITSWPVGYNTSFQLVMENTKTWVHHDCNRWAGIVYLTPGAPIESGTGIYKNKYSNIMLHDHILIDHEQDYNIVPFKDDDWERVSFIGNIFNRLVLYNGYLYHRSVLPGFGTCKYTGRLTQTFFFDTEDL